VSYFRISNNSIVLTDQREVVVKLFNEYSGKFPNRVEKKGRYTCWVKSGSTKDFASDMEDFIDTKLAGMI